MARALRDPRTRALLLVALLLLLCAFTLHHVDPGDDAMAMAFGDRQLHLVVRLHYPGMDFDAAARAVELFGEEVVPALKGS